MHRSILTGLAAVLVAATAAASPAALAAPSPLRQPPGEPGTAAYNRWLGRSFNDTLLKERRPSVRVRILKRIVSRRYIQHNPLAPEDEPASSRSAPSSTPRSPTRASSCATSSPPGPAWSPAGPGPAR